MHPDPGITPRARRCPPHLQGPGDKDPANLPAAGDRTSSKRRLSDASQSLAKNQEAEAKAEPQHPVAYVCCEQRRAEPLPTI